MNHSRAYQIYENLLEAAKTADINQYFLFDCTSKRNELFLFLSCELAKEAAPNPLKPDEPGFDEYEDILFIYDLWPEGALECPHKKRFLYAAYHLCELCPTNIFENEEEPIVEVSLEDMKEKEHEEAEKEDIATETYVPVQEPEHVFGVVPFEDEDEFVLDPPSEPMEEKSHGLFKRNKKHTKK